MNTIAWILILTALLIARSVTRGRILNLGEDLSDAFRTLAIGDKAGLAEVLARKGEILGAAVGDASGASSQGFQIGTSIGAAIKGVGWSLDPHLTAIVNTVKKQHPGIEVGTIGDAAHKARKSDHNPDANGVVHAADFMIGSHFSASDAQTLANQLAASGDPKIKYIIYNKRIWENGSWRAYNGSNPHTDHVHLSVK